MKHRVFIGSSKESEEIAITVSEFLSGDYECVVWYNGFFGINKGTYESLAKNAVAYDYAIYIGGGRTTCLYVLKAGKSKYRQETIFIWSLDYMQEFCLQQEVTF